jgi:hypothetical protein
MKTLPSILHTAALLVLVTVAAYADPVRASYTVQVASCETFGQGRNIPLKCQPYPSSFPMTVTLDGTPSTEVIGSSQIHHFEPPTFSAIPISLPELPSAVNAVSSFAHLSESPSDGRFASLHGSRRFHEEDQDFFYGHEVDLFGQDEFVFRDPPLLGLLGLAGAFSFAYLEADIHEGPDAGILYLGTAVLDSVTPDPVPEPSSVLLFATGAAALGRRVWRRRRDATNACQLNT